MPATAEQFVNALNQASSLFQLSDDLQVFKEGLTDMVRRVRALEDEVKVLQSEQKAT